MIIEILWLASLVEIQNIAKLETLISFFKIVLPSRLEFEFSVDLKLHVYDALILIVALTAQEDVR